MKGSRPPNLILAAQALGGKKAREIPTLTEFMLLNTQESFKIQTKSRPKCKGYWSWDFIAKCKSIFSKTCSRSLVPHLKYFACTEWICWLPVASINYEVQISQGLDPAGVALTALLQALNGGQLCLVPGNALIQPLIHHLGLVGECCSAPNPQCPSLNHQPHHSVAIADWSSHTRPKMDQSVLSTNSGI